MRRSTILPLAAVAALASCDRTVTPTEALPPLEASSLDAGAGAWRTIVLTTADQIPVAAPAAVTSPAYAAELAAVKAAQASITDAQRANVRFWSAGGRL
jgi:uncharacterized lipoprotein YajG